MGTKYYPVIDVIATGKNILRLRKAQGYSVADLQEFLGFEAPQAIYKWQSGKSLPSTDNLFALSVFFEVSIEDMIGCRVVGGVDYQRSSNDIGKMETQANALTPRIQMPMPSFKVAASRRLNEIRAKLGKRDLIDLMEPLIDQLAQDYGVSRLAAKIRLMEAGFTEAIGTFNYVDGHYVRPYSFKSGSLKESQTFTLSAADAGVQWLMNPELRKLTENGDYLFVENHFVFNTKQYVQYREDGELQLTEYARRHMDECCLIFDMKIKSNVDKQYYTECYLNRETSDVTFEITFHSVEASLHDQCSKDLVLSQDS